MDRNSIPEYSVDPSQNIKIGSLGIDGSVDPVRNFDDGLQTLMAHLADMNAGNFSIHDTFTLSDPDDATKQFRFDGVNITTGQKRIITVPDKDILLHNAKDNGLLTGFRNKLIDGNFDIWQRATSQTSSGYGSADRWDCFNSSTAKTASQQSFTSGQTDVPGNPKYFMRHVVTSASTVSSSCGMVQRIEGCETLAGKEITIPLYAKADASRTIAIEVFRNYGTGGSPSSAESLYVEKVNLTTSWQRFNIKTTLPSMSGKVIGTDGNDSLQMVIWFDAGSNNDARTDSLGNQSGTFDIARVSFVAGDATEEDDPHGARHIALEEFLCDAYYQEYDLSDSGLHFPMSRFGASTGAPLATLPLRTKMRNSPSFSQSGAWNAGTGFAGTPTADYLGSDVISLRATNTSAANGVLYLQGGIIKLSAEF